MPVAWPCCFRGGNPHKVEVLEKDPPLHAMPQETCMPKLVPPPAQPEVGGGQVAGTPTHQTGGGDEVVLQHAASRLAKHMLERQPSRSKQSLLLGGPTGQRWAQDADASPTETWNCNRSTAAAGLLLQVRIIGRVTLHSRVSERQFTMMRWRVLLNVVFPS